MSNADTFKISSDRLEVELAYPSSAIQKGARFDLSGHVVQVVLDGKHVFAAPEGYDEKRGSGGLGLCNEFADTTQAMYSGAAIGEKFPKMGVGLLTREGPEDYFFMTHYEKAPYPMEVSVSGGSAQFHVEPVECRGYTARLVKKLSVQSNMLTIEYLLENVGSQPMNLVEYNHNFVCIDNQKIGPGYRLTLPYSPEIEKTPEILSVQNGEITWKYIPGEGEAFFCLPKGFDKVSPHRWELVHEPSGVGMRETDDFPVDHLALWGMNHVVSPEVFIRLNLAPGESKKWSRRYEFFSK